MPERYWKGPIVHVVFGALIAVIAAVLIWDVSAMLTEQRIRYEEGAKAAREQAQERIELNCGADLTPALLRSCIENEIAAEEDANRAERNLEAQEEVALFTHVIGYTGIAGLLVGFLSIVLADPSMM